MKKKETYESPETIWGSTRIRCSILAGSGKTNDNPSNLEEGQGGGSMTQTGKDPNDARKRGLTF